LRAGSESFSFIILSVQDRPDLHVREAIAHCNIKQEERVLLDSGASKTRRMNRTNAKAFGRKMLCLLAFLVTVAKYLREEIEEEVFILGHGFSVSVHHGGEGMIEQSSSHHGGPDRERERGREREWLLQWALSFFPLYSTQVSNLWGAATHIQGRCSAFLSPLWKSLPDTPRGVLY
jgi:hypothetical protein